ncbi:hypothetical protein GCM10009609_76090 [Pseudonocardia aurantiaca]
MQMHVHFVRHACTCTTDLHLQGTTGTLLSVHVSTLFAALASGDADGVHRVDVTGASSRLVDGLRARFRRGSHRLGNDPRRQWTMTEAQAQGSTPLRDTVGRTEGDVRQWERNPLQSHVRNGLTGWHAT